METKSKSPVSIRIRLKYPDVDTFIAKYSANISENGIFIQTRTPPPIGTILRFELQLQDGQPLLRGEGRVLWIKEYNPALPSRAHGLGLRFLRLDVASKAILDRVVAHKKSEDASLPSSDTQAILPVKPSDPGSMPTDSTNHEKAPVQSGKELKVEEQASENKAPLSNVEEALAKPVVSEAEPSPTLPVTINKAPLSNVEEALAKPVVSEAEPSPTLPVTMNKKEEMAANRSAEVEAAFITQADAWLNELALQHALAEEQIIATQQRALAMITSDTFDRERILDEFFAEFPTVFSVPDILIKFLPTSSPSSVVPLIIPPQPPLADAPGSNKDLLVSQGEENVTSPALHDSDTKPIFIVPDTASHVAQSIDDGVNDTDDDKKSDTQITALASLAEAIPALQAEEASASTVDHSSNPLPSLPPLTEQPVRFASINDSLAFLLDYVEPSTKQRAALIKEPLVDSPMASAALPVDQESRTEENRSLHPWPKSPFEQDDDDNVADEHRDIPLDSVSKRGGGIEDVGEEEGATPILPSPFHSYLTPTDTDPVEANRETHLSSAPDADLKVATYPDLTNNGRSDTIPNSLTPPSALLGQNNDDNEAEMLTEPFPIAREQSSPDNSIDRINNPPFSTTSTFSQDPNDSTEDEFTVVSPMPVFKELLNQREKQTRQSNQPMSPPTMGQDFYTVDTDLDTMATADLASTAIDSNLDNEKSNEFADEQEESQMTKEKKSGLFRRIFRKREQ